MKNENIIIRPMQLADVEAVAEIEKICFSLPWSEKAYRDTLTNENALYLVAELTEPDNAETGNVVPTEPGKRKIVGMCGVLKILDEGDISNVAVYPAYRRRSIARLMMDELLKKGEELGIDSFTLEVRAGNEAAIKLYEHFGFRTEGIRKRFYDKPVEDALIMWRRKENI